jgi:hypothetical protein
MANKVVHSTTMRDHILFLHAALFQPHFGNLAPCHFRGHFITWPGLTTANVRRYLPKSEATAKGHLDQQRKNLRSTKTSPLSDIEADYHPTPETEPTNLVFAAVLDYETATHLIHSDLTGRFPVQSSRGMNYVLVVYDYDSNAILAEPMRNRTDAEMLRAYGVILNRLIARGLKPKLQRLDNEASTALKKYLQEEMDISTNLSHLTSIASQCCRTCHRTFKNHFISGLASPTPTFHFIFGAAWSTSGGNLKHATHLQPQSKTLGLQLSLWRT